MSNKVVVVPPQSSPGAGSTSPHAQPNSPRTNYAAVNGLRIYYEIHGTGEPLILLHGGIGASEMFSAALPALAESRQVIAVHLQGHGRTRDIDRPLRYEYLADDIAALMRSLSVEPTDILGYSFGDGVALRTTIQHPELVRRLIVVSVPFSWNGWFPEVRAGFNQMGPEYGEMMKQSPLFRLYPDVDWRKLFGKMHDLQSTDYDWSEEVAAIKAPTMLMFADADAVRPAHCIQFYELLGGGKRDAGLDGSGRPVTQLAIIPGATHYNVVSTPAFPVLVHAFLDSPHGASGKIRNSIS